ncbi:MAG: hypothetical protein Q8K85_22480 [Hyphomicrobium sp.]|nr:hypothetical protein [Hyphomicrobium sp.]
MTEAHTPLVERIARVLAGTALSSNADGANPSAGRTVDECWPDYRDTALAVIRELREPDAAMAAAGDAAIWSNMVRTVLEGAETTPV